MNGEELVRLRSYLAKQFMQRSPAQILEALQKAYHQFATAAVVLPDRTFLDSLDRVKTRSRILLVAG